MQIVNQSSYPENHSARCGGETVCLGKWPKGRIWRRKEGEIYGPEKERWDTVENRVRQQEALGVLRLNTLHLIPAGRIKL